MRSAPVAKKSVTNPIRVATIGLDERSQQVLRMAFSGAGKGACEITDEKNADVGLCNMDSSDAKTLWRNYRKRYPQRPTVVIGLRNPALTNTCYVSKPIKVDLLINAIKQVHADGEPTPQESTTPQEVSANHSRQSVAHMRKAHSGNNALDTWREDAPVSAINWNEELKEATVSFYSPQEFLQGEIHTVFNLAGKSGVATQLSIMIDDRWKTITADPVRNKVASEIDDDQLEKLCNTPLFCIAKKSNRLSKKETELVLYRNEETQYEESIEQFLWKIALWTSAGRMPEGTKPANPIRLRHWPNLTRLKQTPNGIRIAALLSDQPSPPALVAKVLNVPLQQVFSFYAATHALGLTASAEDNTKITSSFKAPAKNRHHSLFGRILNRLGGRD